VNEGRHFDFPKAMAIPENVAMEASHNVPLSDAPGSWARRALLT
jgi:hypothetical protein